MNPETGPDVHTDFDVREPSWSRLVDRIQAGDPAGMEQLYAVFVKGVRFFLWRQLGPQDLDDARRHPPVVHRRAEVVGGGRRAQIQREFHVHREPRPHRPLGLENTTPKFLS